MEGGLLVDMTIIGEVEEGRAVRRDTGRAGDIVWVTGVPGSAAAGLALLRAGIQPGAVPGLDGLIHAYIEPRGRAREGRKLGESGLATAMIDVSDGLVGDLGHLVEGSDMGILLKEEAVPVGEDLRAAGARLGRPPESFIYSASDDYELLFTTAPDRSDRVAPAIREISDAPVWPIGELIEGGKGQVIMEDRSGRRRPLIGGGWDHFRIEPSA